MLLNILEEETSQCTLPSSGKHICSYIQNNCDYNYFKISTLYYCKYHNTTTLIIISFFILLSLILILISLSILVSNYLFKNLNCLTTQLNLNSQILSFILIPLTNSLPDLLNYYIALKSGSVDLVIGQLMGSLLIMFTIIIGLICILTSGYFIEHPKILMLDLSILLIIMILFLEILSDGKITQSECWLMIASYLIYILFLMFFDKDKLKEFDEEVVIEYNDHLHLYEHPYNIEDAVSILSHEDVTSYGSIKSVSRLNSPSIIVDYNNDIDNDITGMSSNSLQVPGKSFHHSLHSDSSSSDKSPLLVSQNDLDITINSDYDDEEEVEEYLDNSDLEDEILIVPQQKQSIIQKFLNLIDLTFSLTIPYHKHIESKHKQLIIIWYIFETFLIFNYQFFQLSFIYSIPLSLLIYLINKIFKIPNNLKIILISFIGLSSSLIIISNVAILTLYLLKNLGLILKISDYLLGLLVFSLSNSLNDTITNLTISTKINPILGINSCIGTPLLIILLGIGVNGLIMTLKTGKSIDFHLTQNVIISTVGLLTSILLLIIYLPLNNYKIDKKIGGILVLLYFLITIVQVYLE